MHHIFGLSYRILVADSCYKTPEAKRDILMEDLVFGRRYSLLWCIQIADSLMGGGGVQFNFLIVVNLQLCFCFIVSESKS